MYAGAVCCYRLSSVVCRFVYLSVTIVRRTKTDELIEMPFGFWTGMGPRKHVLSGLHTGAT